MSEPAVELEHFDGDAVAVLTLRDDAWDNALSPDMARIFAQQIEEIKDDPKLRVVVICGAGQHFSSGGHKETLLNMGSGKMGKSESKDFMLSFYDQWLSLLDLPVPVISAIHGDCIGDACIFPCVADIAVADETARI